MTVHFVLHSGPNQGSHRPAVVVNTDNGMTDLQVFCSGNPKLGDEMPNVFWRYRVPFDATGKQIGSWHYPEWQQANVRPSVIMEGQTV